MNGCMQFVCFNTKQVLDCPSNCLFLKFNMDFMGLHWRKTFRRWWNTFCESCWITCYRKCYSSSLLKLCVLQWESVFFVGKRHPKAWGTTHAFNGKQWKTFFASHLIRKGTLRRMCANCVSRKVLTCRWTLIRTKHVSDNWIMSSFSRAFHRSPWS